MLICLKVHCVQYVNVICADSVLIWTSTETSALLIAIDFILCFACELSEGSQDVAMS